MKHVLFLMIILLLNIFQCIAQDSKGDLFNGLSKPITENQVIPAFGLEVTFDKTSNIIFPAPILKVDLGSGNLVGGKFPGVENVLRIKAAIRQFKVETNFSVITKDGTFYTFNVRYADEPAKLNINVKDLIYNFEKDSTRQPPIFRKELGQSSTRLTEMIVKTIYKQDKRMIKHIGAKSFGIQCLLRGIYCHEDLIYFYTDIKNTSQISYDIDFVRFKIVDKQVMKRVAVQEIPIVPVEVYNQVTSISAGKRERMVFVFSKFTIPEGKQLLIEVFEKGGGRNYSFKMDNSDLTLARGVDNLKLEE